MKKNSLITTVYSILIVLDAPCQMGPTEYRMEISQYGIMPGMLKKAVRFVIQNIILHGRFLL